MEGRTGKIQSDAVIEGPESGIHPKPKFTNVEMQLRTREGNSYWGTIVTADMTPGDTPFEFIPPRQLACTQPVEGSEEIQFIDVVELEVIPDFTRYVTQGFWSEYLPPGVSWEEFKASDVRLLDVTLGVVSGMMPNPGGQDAG